MPPNSGFKQSNTPSILYELAGSHNYYILGQYTDKERINKRASPEHKLRVCAYVRMSTDSEVQLESFNAQIGRYKRIIQEEHADTWELVEIFADTESGTSIDKRKELESK